MIDEIYKKDGIHLIFDSPSSQSVFIFGSRGNFQQMLMNLLSNAKDAVSDAQQKNIEIVLKEKTENLEIVVKDTGCGIPNELHEKVFEMFFTTKEVNKGTGIGLAQVDNFVKELGGSIKIDSGVGRGTSILIELAHHQK